MDITDLLLLLTEKIESLLTRVFLISFSQRR